MGQTKQRGSFEQRKKESIERAEKQALERLEKIKKAESEEKVIYKRSVFRFLPYIFIRSGFVRS
jgi:hypothetical protein